MSDVIAAIATGTKPCAIGILRLSGAGCAGVAGKVFFPACGKEVSALTPGKLYLGTLRDAKGRTVDHAMIVRNDAPRSYTGEDTAEIHCHGSPAVLAAGLEALYLAGARPAQPGEFTKRAFLNGKTDLTAAEAVADLIDAETADAAANAAGQVGGAILRKIEPVYSNLTDICSHYHAVLDYPDEDIPEFQLADFAATLAADRAELQKLLDTADRGRILKKGIRAAIIGRPNAGKSSLLNALAGYERVIVTEIAGTTRDTVEEVVRCGSVTVRFVDTAGIRNTGDRIEAIGVQRSVQAAEQADLAIFVCDGSEPLTQEDRNAVQTAKKAGKSIGVINKTDLPQKVFPEQLPFDAVMTVSAAEGTGLHTLTSWIEETFRSDLPCDGGILTNERQAEAVRRALAALDSGCRAMAARITPDAVLTDIELAMAALGELTGKTVREDITQRIFERFCVGK